MGLTCHGVDQMRTSSRGAWNAWAGRDGAVPRDWPRWGNRCSRRPEWRRGLEIGGDASAGAEYAFGHPQHHRGQLRLPQLGDRLIEVILHPAKLDLAVLNQGIRGAGISIARLANAARIDDLQPGEGDVHRGVRVADTQKIGREVGGSQLPCLRIFAEVFIKRIAGGGVHQGEPHAVEFDSGLNGQPGEKSQLPGIQPIPLEGTGAGHELAETPTGTRSDPLGDIVVVIPPDGPPRVAPDPIDTGSGIHAVVDQVASEQAGVKRFLDGPQGRPIGMNVGQKQDSHGKPPERTRETIEELYKRESVGLTLARDIISNQGGEATPRTCRRVTAMSEQALEDQSLRERLGHAEQLLRELNEHLAQSFLPTLKRANELLATHGVEDSAEVADSTIRSLMAAVVKSDDFTQQLINSLDPYLRSIQHEVRRIRDGE